MSNIAIVGSTMPSLANPELAALSQSFFEDAFAGFSSSLNMIKPGKMDFTLIEGGNRRTVQNGQLVAVFLGAAPHNYCSWYERAYTPGQEPERPDLLWVQHTPDTFPAALPEKFRQKVNINGSMRWGFRIARRTVWALATVENGQFSIALERPYVMDITSSSMYGASDPQQNVYRWAGLRSFCDRFSRPPTQVCTPAMFLTQIVLDGTSPVSGVVCFRPCLDPSTGNPQFLDSETYAAVIEKALSAEVKNLLMVNEILTYTPVGASVAATVPPAQAAPVQTAQVPPVQTAQAAPVQTAQVPPVQTAQAAPVQTAQVPPVQTAQAAPVQTGTGDLFDQAAKLLGVTPAAPESPAPAQSVQPASAPASANPAAAALAALNGALG